MSTVFPSLVSTVEHTSRMFVSAPFVYHQMGIILNDSYTQPFSKKIIGNFVLLPISDRVDLFVLQNCFIYWIRKTCLVKSIKISKKENLVAVPPHSHRGLIPPLLIPSVRVPVLSEQMIFMLPKFSIEASRFTITFFCSHLFGTMCKVNTDNCR